MAFIVSCLCPCPWTWPVPCSAAVCLPFAKASFLEVVRGAARGRLALGALRHAPPLCQPDRATLPLQRPAFQSRKWSSVSTWVSPSLGGHDASLQKTPTDERRTLPKPGSKHR